MPQGIANPKNDVPEINSGQILYTYFILMQAIVQNICPEGQVPTWHVIAHGKTEGNSTPSWYLS